MSLYDQLVYPCIQNSMKLFGNAIIELKRLELLKNYVLD